MCGICGIFGRVDEKITERMVNAMQHRGPDDQGFYHDSNVALGMSRLAIIDLSALAHQPMCNSQKTIWIIYNGEVYNFQEERRLLETQGYIFSSNSDTEVILRMYECYGDDFLKRLRGMFALAIYDMRSQPCRLLLARDPLGIKPLLWARSGENLVFASEMKALLASKLITPEIDPESLRQLLTHGSVYQPRTIIKGVSMIPAAHKLIAQGKYVRIERYWSFGLDRFSELRNSPYEELVDIVIDALEESVRLHMISDVPVGAFLSGGIDSSLLVGLMARVAGHRVKTFSIGFDTEGADLDESEEAERTASFLGCDHEHVMLLPSHVRDHIRHFAWGLDQPSVDGLNSYFVSQAARQAVTVAISGTGGDEIFAGYPWFTQMVKYEQEAIGNPYRTIKDKFLGKIASLSIFDSSLLENGGEAISELRNRANFISRYATIYQTFGALGAARLISPELRRAARAGRAAYYDFALLDELHNASAVERVTALCLRGYTCNQLLRDIDAVSMAHSLEVRVPFLDVSLLDLALSLPVETKMGKIDNTVNPWTATYRQSGCKRILIDSGRKLGLLRQEIDLQPKRGFTLPLDIWLKGPLLDILEDTLTSVRIRQRGWLDDKVVDDVKKRFLAGHLGWVHPWLLIVLELWWQEVVETH